METFASRLATFSTAQPSGNKKRASNAKGNKGAKWPHKSPSPEQLAQAGFYFRPIASSPDNVQCFSCHKDVDGWESEDDPAKEHVALSPECSWAIQIALEQADEGDDLRNEDPMSERMREARMATFGDMWPHERKRGWTCKVQKMVDAGWYYCPTPESDDFAKCAYCGLCLDGWEPKDKPFDEHQRRSSTCAFFASQPTGKAVTRGKKGRQSKASRMSTQSTQSNVTVTAEDQPTPESTNDHGDSILSAATDMSMMSTASKAKKPGRPKRGQAKSKARNIRAKGTDSQQPSSFIEPEDDDFEVKVATPPARSTRGKKRTSDEMQAGDVDYPVIPPAKRSTKTRSSTVKPEPIPVHLEEADIPMEDAEEIVAAPQSKKGGKGRKRTSSATRKPSGRKAATRSASTASKASLRAAVPADDEIDAQLEADLERLSDGDENWQVLGKDESQVIGLQIPRSRPSAGRKELSSANTRAAPESSALMSQAEVGGMEESESVLFEKTGPIISPPVVKKTRTATKKGRGKKASASISTAKEEESAGAKVAGPMEVDARDGEEFSTYAVEEQVSQKEDDDPQPAKETDDLEGSVVITKEQGNISQLTMTTVADDSGHETDGSLLAQKKAKRDSKKATTKKGKQTKKAAPKTRKVEVTVEVPIRTDSREAEPGKQPVAEEAPIVVVKTKTEKASKTHSAKNQTKAEGVSEHIVSEAPGASLTSGQDDEEAPQSMESVESQPLVEVHIEQPRAPTPTLPQSPKRQIPSPTPTPQSSDAENHPPSARPSRDRPPLARYSPSNARTMRVPLAASTPTGSPSKRNNNKLQTTYPWSPADLDYILLGTPGANKENVSALDTKNLLTSPEKKMSVEEWIKYNAKQGEEKLKNDCEKIVGKFENEGVRALKALEGIVCSD